MDFTKQLNGFADVGYTFGGDYRDLNFNLGVNYAFWLPFLPQNRKTPFAENGVFFVRRKCFSFPEGKMSFLPQNVPFFSGAKILFSTWRKGCQKSLSTLSENVVFAPPTKCCQEKTELITYCLCNKNCLKAAIFDCFFIKMKYILQIWNTKPRRSD